MSSIQRLDMYQTQLRSTQFTSKVGFIKGLANYKENMTLTSKTLKIIHDSRDQGLTQGKTT